MLFNRYTKGLKLLRVKQDMLGKKAAVLWFFVILTALAVAWWNYQNALKNTIPDAYKNTGGEFTLQSSRGAFSLSDWRGKVVLLYFGYTHCPDMCPLTLANWGAAFSRMTAKELENVGGLLITVDPVRDTLAQLNKYTARFHPNIMGLTGDESTLRAVALKYRANFEIVQEDHRGHGISSDSMPSMPMDNSPHGGVEHTSFVYVIGQDGKVRQMLPYTVRPEKLVNSIRRFL